MRDVNWDEIQENTGDYQNPAPGGYIARIVHVEDREDKEYLWVEWDFENGEYKGNNADTFNRAGFWPIVLIRSYKKKALPFFKAFKTCVEVSNPGFAFSTREPGKLAGKLFGVVLGEEEYLKSGGGTGTRLCVHQCKSVKAIEEGDFKVPPLKRLTGSTPPEKKNDRLEELDDDDDELPF